MKNKKLKKRKSEAKKSQVSQNPRNGKKPWVFFIFWYHVFALFFLISFVKLLSSLFCDYSNVIRFCQVFMTFSSFFGRKCCKTQDVHDPLPAPRFPCGRPSRGATRSCRQHLPKSSLDTPVKNNQNPRFVISFLFLFHFISLQFFSLRFIHWFIHSFLPSFIQSFIHSFIHSIIHVMGVPARLLWALGCGVPSTLSRKGTLARPMSSCFFTLYFFVFQKKILRFRIQI